jgi:hypothetical protein
LLMWPSPEKINLVVAHLEADQIKIAAAAATAIIAATK